MATISNIDNDNKTQSLVIDGVTYLPLRFIAENLGYEISYSSENKTIKLNENNIETNSISTYTETETTTLSQTTTILTDTSTETTTITTQSTTSSNSSKQNVVINKPYVANSNTNTLHRSKCHTVKKILPEHIVQFDSLELGKNAGYKLCKICLN